MARPRLSPLFALALLIFLAVAAWVLQAPQKSMSLPESLEISEGDLSRGKCDKVTLNIQRIGAGKYRFLFLPNLSQGYLDSFVVEGLVSNLFAQGLTPEQRWPQLERGERAVLVNLTTTDEQVFWGVWSTRSKQGKAVLYLLQRIKPLVGALR